MKSNGINVRAVQLKYWKKPVTDDYQPLGNQLNIGLG
jgi:hypothetical protein